MAIQADSLTDDNIMFEYVFRQESEIDAFMNKEEFAVRVLSEPRPIESGAAPPSVHPNGHQIFMGRILGITAPSPHQKYLQDPCEISVATPEDEAFVTHLISMHTRFIFYKLSTMEAINVGDIVFARLDAGNGERGGGYNLQIARLERLDYRAQVPQGVDTRPQCTDLSSLDYSVSMGQFSGRPSAFSGQTNSGRYYHCKGNNAQCGPKDDPTFAKCAPPTYSTLPKQGTDFQSYSRDDVIAAIRASGQPEAVQKIMYAFISKEQPGFSFPNNNVAGIQLDMSSGFAGATQSDFDYQTCFRDDGGDQRIFAGFSSLQRGMTVFGKLIAAKMNRFRTLSGASISIDADNLTWNYYRSWNTAFSPEELDQLKATGQVVRGDKTYERNWNATRNGFSNSLEEWSRI